MLALDATSPAGASHSPCLGFLWKDNDFMKTCNGRESRMHWRRFSALAGVFLSAGCTMCQNPYDYAGPVRSGAYPSGSTRSPASGYGAYAAATSVPGTSGPSAGALAAQGNSEGWSASGRPVASSLNTTGNVQGLPPEGTASAPSQQVYR